MKKVLIVGGVATGASAAARLRRLDETAEIVLFEKGDYISFANCGLPYYIGGVIEDREDLLVATPALMKNRFKIDVRVNSEVVKINTAEKTVTVESKEKGTYTESYDSLVIAPGAKPIVPNIPGIENEKIYTLRNVADTDNIKAIADKIALKNINAEDYDIEQLNSKVKPTTEDVSVIVIGGGFIGVEMAENIKELGINVTLIEAADHIMAPFDEDIVVTAEKKMNDEGIKLILNDKVVRFNDLEDGIEVELGSGKKVKGAFVVSAIGVTPDTGFLKETDIKLGARGHIVVDNQMRTSVADVFAGGDAVEVIDFVNGNVTAVPLAGPANKQGRIIADNIAGKTSVYKNTQGTSVIKIFNLEMAGTGNNEKTLKRLNIPYNVVLVHPNNHAGYYPGAVQLTLKLIFSPAGKILGAQAVGIDGAVKRIDVIAAVLRMGGTIYDLTEMELSYAPPFGSAKDAVNMAGYVAENILSGESDNVHPRELKNIVANDNIVVLDVRTKGERDAGKVEGSIHINVNELRQNLDKLDASKEYWIHCAVGIRAYIAERILKQNGFKCKNITGGYKSIKALEFTPNN